MSFSYDKLWKILIDKKMTKEAFRKLIKASPTTIAAMGRGEGISPKVLERICIAFNCQPGDIMEYIPQPNETDPDIEDDDFIPEFMRDHYDPHKKEFTPEPKPENTPKCIFKIDRR